MNLRCGVDLMEIARFEREVTRQGGDLVSELFSAAELAWCQRRRRPAEGYAMGYAAKEALFKALGTGKLGRMAWGDIEVAWPEGTAGPRMVLTGETAKMAESLGVTGVHVALARSREYGMAWVVVTGRGPRPADTPSRSDAHVPGDYLAGEPGVPGSETRPRQEGS